MWGRRRARRGGHSAEELRVRRREREAGPAGEPGHSRGFAGSNEGGRDPPARPWGRLHPRPAREHPGVRGGIGAAARSGSVYSLTFNP